MSMGYEIDFLPVGNGEKSGDAIAIRYGSSGDYKIMVIDGGTKESGQALVDHIKEQYNTDYVNFVVNTHPDGDHASGLTIVLEQLSVGQLWMHRPWEHSQEIRNLFKDGRITDNSLSERLKDALNAAYALEELANEKNIPIFEPFQGETIGEFTVLSPEKEWYLQDLIPNFRKTPETKTFEKASVMESLLGLGKSIANKTLQYILETWDYETLKEGSTTSFENQSSVILYGEIEKKGILLTGDAGVNALSRAADFADIIGIDIKQSSFIQVPHHGSRNNVSPSILDRIVGPKVGINSSPTKTAVVSASKESTTHPRRVVTNAFKRRGAKVLVTKGKSLCSHYNFPKREGWVTAEPLPFFDEVEE